MDPKRIILPADLRRPAGRAPLDVKDKQSRLNRSTSGQWHLYASHRRELERLLVPQAPGGRICVLGAGNCNDLDLQWLTGAFREVQLVDIDGDALHRAAKFQELDGCKKLLMRGGIDLTGVADQLGTWVKAPPAPAAVEECTRRAAEATGPLATELGGPFDVVLSPCVLSQLLTPLRDTIGPSHCGFDALFAAMRGRHFRLMLDLLAPGGRAVFACDLFSSVVLPELPRVEHGRLPDVMRTMVAREKHFSGLDPETIAAVFRRDRAIAPQVTNLRTAAPWLWHLGLSKTYLVYAFTFCKSGAAPVDRDSTITFPSVRRRP